MLVGGDDWFGERGLQDTVIDQRTSLISVIGEVNTPSRFPASAAGEHILDAITRAGGPKGQGYDTVLASSIPEAALKIRIHKPVLILMDVCLSDQDGYSFCNRLKNDPDTNQVRVIMMSDPERSPPELQHWAERQWKKLIVPDDLPGLKFWQPGTQLPLVHQTNHLKPPHIRAVQRFIHAFCLPMLDRQRPKFPANSKPQPIPKEIVEKLQQELSES